MKTDQYSIQSKLSHLNALKQKSEKIACLTAYDASFSRLLERQGIEVILVGDSLGMVCQGENSTLPVTMDHMIYHTHCVTKGIQQALLISDMPYQSYTTAQQALTHAHQLIQAGAEMVKLEGAHVDIIKTIRDENIAVCAHLGLLPQSIEHLEGYKVQGRDTHSAERIFQDALAVEKAGAQLLVLECIPAKLAAEISQHLAIPVIGIGAGPDCDGQVLVLYDILNLDVGRKPRFVKNFMQGAASIDDAIKNYRDAVKFQNYPGDEHCY